LINQLNGMSDLTTFINTSRYEVSPPYAQNLGKLAVMLRGLIVLLLLTCASALAQTPTGDLLEVRVEGTTDTLADLVKINLNARSGTPIERIDLEAERNRVLAMGTFATVSVSIEDRGNGPILFVQVQENPPIAEIVIAGSRYPENRLLEVLNEANLLREGSVYNSFRAQEGRTTVQRGYDEVGWPFRVPVTLDIEEVPDSPLADPNRNVVPVRLIYNVEEAVPLDEVRFEGNTVIADEVLEDAFRTLSRSDVFDFDTYQAAVREVGIAYEEAGYRGSGINRASSDLVDSVLTVRMRELTIASLNTTAIGVDPSELSLQPGELFNYDQLLQDVLRIAEGRTADIRLDYPTTVEGGVRVIFSSGPPESAGPVEEVSLEGNTVLTNEEIREVMTLDVGDTFTSEVAAEDFREIQQLYTERGYIILSQPDFNFVEGVYVQRFQEVTVAGYDVLFEEDGARTRESVITRYLNPVGTVYNQNELRNDLLRVARLGVVEPFDVRLNFGDPERPSSATISVLVRERETRNFTPQVTYSTDSGLLASVGYSDRNFLGRAQNLGIDITGQTSDNGLQFGGSLTWSVPWLYINVLDFQETPTSLSVSLFSVVDTDQPLTEDGSRRIAHPCVAAGSCESIEENDVLIGDFVERNTGLRLSVGRPVFEDTVLRVSASGSYSSYDLEDPSESCEFDANGNVVDNDCSLERSDAEEFIPQTGLFTFFSTEMVYDTRDNPEFPASGLRALGRAGIGFGDDFNDPDTNEQASYSYQQLEFGVSTYLALAPQRNNHVLAFKANVGQQFGGDYPTRRRFNVGNTTNTDTQIRGYTRDDFDPSQTYLVGTAEYRYDFGLSSPLTQTVVGIAFVDAGYASSVPDFEDNDAPIFFGAGLGVQINVGFGGALLAPVRLDYGFSEKNSSGVLNFRLGYVF
jgi:outer membrane protein insertion porin family